MRTKIKTKTVRQSVTFRASPHKIYEMLMDSRKHSKFTGGKARISRKVGGRFSIFDGGLHGTNLKLVRDKKVVQSWRCAMKGWPKHHFSKTTFALKKTKKGTRLVFTQSGVPASFYKDIYNGWKEYYWQPMKEMLK